MGSISARVKLELAIGHLAEVRSGAGADEVSASSFPTARGIAVRGSGPKPANRDRRE